jgi:hypothetical protein
MISKAWRLSIIPALLLMLSPAFVAAQSVSVSVNIAPPELPVYDQPPIPGDGYIWSPGYWAWDDGIQDYYWVPGTWVEAPEPGYLWTPGYWAADGAAFLWHAGYWGPQVGFYGGVDYGYGYGGRGYAGGYWRGGHLFYNRAVVNIGSAHIRNVYNKSVVNNIHVTRVSFNGGHGGVRAQATAAEMAASRGRHVQATSAQVQQRDTARGNPELRHGSNHGHPPIAATPRAGNFAHPVPSRNAVTAPSHNPQANPAHATPRPRVSAPRERPVTPQERPTEHAAPTERRAPTEHTAPAEHAAPEHRAPTGRPAPQPRVNTPRERPVAPARPAPAEHPAPAQHPAPQERARPPAAVEPRREPEHTQSIKPPPRAQERPAPRPAEHPAEHPQDHEHH